jgi:hypothetical protein
VIAHPPRTTIPLTIDGSNLPRNGVGIARPIFQGTQTTPNLIINRSKTPPPSSRIQQESPSGANAAAKMYQMHVQALNGNKATKNQQLLDRRKQLSQQIRALKS